MPNRDEHMDDLFRAAAENYRLKEGESQWDRISTALSEKPAMVESIQPRRDQKTNRFLLLLLLLLSFGTGMYIFLHRNTTTITHVSIQAQVTSTEEKATETNPKKATTLQSLSIDNSSLKEKDNSQNNKSNIETISTFIHDAKHYSRGAFATNKNTSQQMRPALTTKTADPQYKTIYQATIHYTESGRWHRQSFSKINQLLGEPPSKATNVASPSISSLLSRNATLLKANLDTSRLKLATTGKQQRGAYVGFVLGPELNQVKSQGPRKPGFDVGLIGGYRFNKRVAVESGFLFAKKFYYSDGKYFKMPGMPVISLEGCTSIFEIPLKLQYNVINKPSGSIFSAAGISSYLMTGEKNDYLLIINGSRQSMTSAYKEASRYFAAAADLSIGYEKKIRNRTTIRIEPYIQIPLKGIGVGTMPVMSTGIHAGVSRSFY